MNNRDKLRDVVVRRQGMDDDGNLILVFVLSCKHGGSVPWWKRNNIGKTRHCKECK